MTPYQAANVNYLPMAGNAEASDRAKFIRSTYLHLFGAILLLVTIDTAIFAVLGDRLEGLVNVLFSGWTMLLFFGGFMVVTVTAESWARSGASKPVQYLALGVYVLAQAIFFVPILYIANVSAPGAISSAGIVTLVVFGGLTLTVFVTKADFAFLGMFLRVVGFAALGLIVASFFFGLELGNWFSVVMVVFAAGYILYDTSNIMLRYRTDQSVAAALSLFASVALMFFYILRLFMGRD